MLSFSNFNLAFKKYFLIALPFLLMSGMCEDDAIEVEVADNFVNTFHITDKGSFSEFFQTGEVDLGDLIEKHGDVLKSSNLEDVTLTLRNYDVNSITVDAKIEIGDMTVVDNTYTLSDNQVVDLELVNSFNLIQEIQSGKYTYKVSFSSETPLNDDDFYVDITSNVTITVVTN
jgi:hypothetical protein